jgi:hypothetical protein
MSLKDILTLKKNSINKSSTKTNVDDLFVIEKGSDKKVKRSYVSEMSL